jgi:catechol 2,3-dioxygenase-like lactoylglutathione lyase family enzyme
MLNLQRSLSVSCPAWEVNLLKHVPRELIILVFVHSHRLNNHLCKNCQVDGNRYAMTHHLRIARPVTNIDRSASMYCQGLGLKVIGRFEGHLGFSGVMLGQAGGQYHFEFTHCEMHPIQPSATVEDLVVLYFPDRSAWEAACAMMTAAGFTPVKSINPYWDSKGRTFSDGDGYRTVLQNMDWQNVPLD